MKSAVRKNRIFFLALLILAGVTRFPALAHAESCEKRIQLQLSSNAVAGGSSHAAATFDLPISCAFYDEVRVGDDLLRKKFRWGTFATEGSMETFTLEISKKYLDNPTNQGLRCEKIVVAGLGKGTVGYPFIHRPQDFATRTELRIPVGCDTFERVAVGDNLFRGLPWAGKALNALTEGPWKLRVYEKRQDVSQLLN